MSERRGRWLALRQRLAVTAENMPSQNTRDAQKKVIHWHLLFDNKVTRAYSKPSHQGASHGSISRPGWRPSATGDVSWDHSILGTATGRKRALHRQFRDEHPRASMLRGLDGMRASDAGHSQMPTTLQAALCLLGPLVTCEVWLPLPATCDPLG